jgi:crotonobetainyl-CoA:carnitine CoA-transferase CaiB-like acyl-CoA transferase
MAGALSGIRVADFTEYIAGPYCTMMLADMGADVVKIERPDGDMWRHTAPVAPYESRVFLGLNRGKRSISLDMVTPEGREIARRLAVEADVVVVNYRPGVVDRLGLDYESLSADNPGLVYCENSAFGKKGPYAGRPGFDILSQASTGIVLYENKIVEGTPSQIQTLAIADLTTAMWMAFAIVNALYVRAQTGKGQQIETSLFASGLAAQYRPLLSVEMFDQPVRDGFLEALREMRREGASYAEIAEMRKGFVPGRGRNNYYRLYETRDGLVAISCLNNRQRRAARDALGVEDETVEGLTYDWFSEEVRQAHRSTTPRLEEAFKSRTTAEWLAALDAVDVPCAPANFTEEMFDLPHVVENGLIQSLEHEVVGTLRMPVCPVTMSETQPGTRLAPPALGAHSAEVLRELGYDEAAVERLMEDGVVWTRERRLASEE